MPCGCQGTSGSGSMPHQMAETSKTVETARVAVFEVLKDKEVKITTSSPSAAREEARRLGGSVRVTSRPVVASEPVSA